MFGYLIGIFQFFSIYSRIVLSECNVCSTTTSVACLTENSFRFCFGGILDPSTPIVSCPPGFNCVNSPEICSITSLPTCVSACGRCSSDGRFACINQNTFALCLGTPNPTSITSKCPDGTVCDITAQNFCITPTNGETGSCLLNQTVTTQIPPTTISPTNICKTLYNRPGRYPVLGTSCKSYLYCYQFGGNLLGQQYNCTGSTLFDPVRQLCVANSTCTA